MTSKYYFSPIFYQQRIKSFGQDGATRREKKPAFDSETACLGSLEDVCSDWPLYEPNG